MSMVKLWALRTTPYELRGVILADLNDMLQVSSFLLQRNKWLDKTTFIEECISYSLPIPEDIIVQAEEKASPIIFNPKDKDKYKVKNY